MSLYLSQSISLKLGPLLVSDRETLGEALQARVMAAMATTPLHCSFPRRAWIMLSQQSFSGRLMAILDNHAIRNNVPPDYWTRRRK